MTERRPRLSRRTSADRFREYYWLKAELAEFAVAHGILASGKKRDIAARIERFLRTGSAQPEAKRKPRKPVGPRDSQLPLTRSTPVVHWVCDDSTRAFFEQQLGASFHFTVGLNRLARSGKSLTYGDLIDAWLGEKQRRRDPAYKPRLGRSGEYNLYVRDFFADPANAGKTLRDAATGWNQVKKNRGPRKYVRRDA